jgi:hypothetical protein
LLLAWRFAGCFDVIGMARWGSRSHRRYRRIAADRAAGVRLARHRSGAAIMDARDSAEAAEILD